MKIRRCKHHTLAALFFVLTVGIPTYAVGQEKASFQGEVTSIVGQRIQITLQDGQSIFVTTSQDITGLAVGQVVTGVYTPVGDSMLATDLIVKSKSQ